jgi:hypothetical protein
MSSKIRLIICVYNKLTEYRFLCFKNYFLSLSSENRVQSHLALTIALLLFSFDRIHEVIGAIIQKNLATSSKIKLIICI